MKKNMTVRQLCRVIRETMCLLPAGLQVDLKRCYDLTWTICTVQELGLVQPTADAYPRLADLLRIVSNYHQQILDGKAPR